MSQKQNQINIELSDEVSKGKYANLAMIAHSSSEFVIDLSLNDTDPLQLSDIDRKLRARIEG